MPAHPDRMMLRKYDPVARTWNLGKEGEFWDAVRLAHELGRRGEGVSIAVIDDGFDVGLPALAEQTLHWPERNDATSDHGTVVALLILEVAPDATLHLFPTHGEQFLDEAAVVRAVDEAGALGVQVINMSLGIATPLPEIAEDDLHLQFDHDDWRVFIQPPNDAIAAAVSRVLAGTDATVVAAAGNSSDSVFSPASVRGVFAVGFTSITRFLDDHRQSVAQARHPSFDQSLVMDFSVRQPRHTVGSSFATPLITGFIAAAVDRGDLEHYRRAAVHSSFGGLVQGDPNANDPSASYDLAFRAYTNAWVRLPENHRHLWESEPCPACSLFSVDLSVNFALIYLMQRRLDQAEPLLVGAESFAPQNPDAAADLGVLRAMQADVHVAAGEFAQASALLAEGSRLMSKAIGLRQPENPQFVRRMVEFRNAAVDPSVWRFIP